MAEVRVGKNESLDTALKRFKRSCAKDGVSGRRSLRQLVSASINCIEEELHSGHTGMSVSVFMYPEPVCFDRFRSIYAV